ncbi:TonB-dependent receptor [Dyadobacter sp. CY261]|uniref:TonB-dependent receptor n=1 Tax=Dyadobacter sp. CY261 TaxID=2907203 RepID=UPI001F2C5B3F|nr:TonB-dependent receptor [Dyadobacter sp. CY261]MCF0075297.1 TonB-dependent receptor [Dyadobacter sp. CY261]
MHLIRLLTKRSRLCYALITILASGFLPALAQGKFTLSGTLKDQSSGETLIGATVFVRETKSGASTNAYGFYSLTLAAGTYQVEYTYMGFEKVEKQIVLDKDVQANIDLPTVSNNLEEVRIVDDRDALGTKSVEMSVNKLDIRTIKKLPALLGEVDIVKSLQFLPGVSQVGEGSSGFNVRGGSVGQNLVLLDEAPMFNSSHMLGFFSVFNPDAVKDVKLYKGAIPSQYGGRLSSVLDVRLKEGNMKKYEVEGGLGLIFSRVAVQGPLKKDQGSFIFAARRSYADVLAGPFLDSGFGLNFYDFTLKTNYKLNAKNHIYLSGFLGRDNMGLSDAAGINWGNRSGTLRWNSVINSKLFFNLSGIFSNYDFNLETEQDAQNNYSWKSQITNYVIKPDFSYFINENSELKFGLEGSYYQFDPSTTKSVSNGETTDNSQEQKNGLEMAAYLNHRLKIGPKLEVQYGLRFSYFNYMGAGTAYTYNDTIPGRRRSVVAQQRYESGESIQTYQNLEPRISAKYQINESSSVKTSYSRTAQYVHFISNTIGSNPLNIWTPSSNNLKPVVGDQLTLGYFKDIGETGTYEVSAEAFYRTSANEVDYISGAEVLANEFLEGDLLSGKGRAYGLELYFQKKKGDFTGWVSYTLSRSELQVNGINNGDWYAARFDQTHNLKIVGSYAFNKKWSATTDFTYTTGTPTTYPNQRYVSQGQLIPFNSTNSRNSTRITPYHRLDLSLRMEGKSLKRNGKPRKMTDYWVFSAYNVYARQNAFSVFFSQSNGPVGDIQRPLQAEANRLSIIGTVIPSVSYNFKF